MVYVGQGRMPGNSITARAPLVIRTVRMASVSTNVLRSTLLVSSLSVLFLPTTVIFLRQCSSASGAEQTTETNNSN